jgi:hypothetical protein
VVVTSSPTAAALELRVGDQVRLSLPASMDSAWLGALLRATSGC